MKTHETGEDIEMNRKRPHIKIRCDCIVGENTFPKNRETVHTFC
jgi:hypothetical protein